MVWKEGEYGEAEVRAGGREREAAGQAEMGLARILELDCS